MIKSDKCRRIPVNSATILVMIRLLKSVRISNPVLLLCLNCVYGCLIGGSVVGCASVPHLDKSGLRPWTRSLESEYPENQPVLAHYQKNDYELTFLASKPSTDLNSPTLRLVNELFARQEIKALLIESLINTPVASPSWFLENARKSQGNGFIAGGETSQAALIADEKKIPFFGTESDPTEIYRSLRNRGYNDVDIVGFYVVQQIPRWVLQNENKIGLLDRLAPAFIFQNCKSFASLTCPNLSDIRNWFKLKEGKELTADVSAEEVEPLVHSRFYLQKIASDISEMRDVFTLNILNKFIDRYKKIAVVYSSTHYITLRKSLDSAFGRPSFREASPN